MVDLMKITLTSGIPTAGDGDVDTINAMRADGGLVTMGAKADVKVTNPVGSASQIALLKGILEAVNTIASRLPASLGIDGSLKIDGDLGAPLPVSLSSVPTHNVFVQQKGFLSTASFTTGTTAYTAGDVIGANAAAAAQTFTPVASGAAVISIDEVMLEIDRAAVQGGETTYRLYLYNVTPPSALVDNAAFNGLAAGDRSSFLGFIDLAQIVTLGATCFIAAQPAKIIRTASASIYGYLVTNGGYTPTAVVNKITMATREIG